MQWFVEEKLFYNTMVQKKKTILPYNGEGKAFFEWKGLLDENLPRSMLRTEVAGW